MKFKKNKNGKRYFELKHCIMYFHTRKRKRGEGIFILPTVWVSRNIFSVYNKVLFYPKAIQFSFMCFDLYIIFDDKWISEHIS